MYVDLYLQIHLTYLSYIWNCTLRSWLCLHFLGLSIKTLSFNTNIWTDTAATHLSSSSSRFSRCQISARFISNQYLANYLRCKSFMMGKSVDAFMSVTVPVCTCYLIIIVERYLQLTMNMEILFIAMHFIINQHKGTQMHVLKISMA